MTSEKPFWKPGELEERIARVRASRVAAGLPPSIEDPATLARMVALLKSSTRKSTGQ